jgi:hypothetical protein
LGQFNQWCPELRQLKQIIVDEFEEVPRGSTDGERTGAPTAVERDEGGPVGRLEPRQQEKYAGNEVDPGDEEARPQRIRHGECTRQSTVQIEKLVELCPLKQANEDGLVLGQKGAGLRVVM